MTLIAASAELRGCRAGNAACAIEHMLISSGKSETDARTACHEFPMRNPSETPGAQVVLDNVSTFKSPVANVSANGAIADNPNLHTILHL